MRNVILLTIDACRKDALGCYSGSGLTPFIDSIQDRCIRFNNDYSGGPYTQAGFPAILSSSYYLDFGRTKGTCPPGRVLISEVLKKQGITSAAFHSNAYLAAFFGWNRGWISTTIPWMWTSTTSSPTFPRGKSTKRRRTGSGPGRANDKPFLLWVHYMDVHEPYVVTKEYLEAVDPNLNMTKAEQFALFKDVILKRDVANRAGIEVLHKLYLAKVHEIDAAIKEFFGILREPGMKMT